MRRWRTLLAGGALAAVGFVAAQAGSLEFLKIELGQLTQGADDKPIVVKTSNAAHRSYSTASPGREQSMLAGPAHASGSGAAARLGFDGVPADGETTMDAVGLFDLSRVAMPMGQPASSGPLEFGGRFRALLDGADRSSQRPAYGDGSQKPGVKKGLADCCDGDPAATLSDPAALQSDPRLTAPTLTEGVGGAAPEASAWALMILGFGLSGLALRGERRRLAA
jgi:hypothetical protein